MREWKYHATFKCPQSTLTGRGASAATPVPWPASRRTTSRTRRRWSSGTGKYMAAGEKWNEVYHYEEGTYPAVRAQVIALTWDKCTMCAHRLAVGLLPACVITCMGITREFGDYEDVEAQVSRRRAHGGRTPRRRSSSAIWRTRSRVWSAVLRPPAATFPPTTAVNVTIDGDSEESTVPSTHRGGV